MVYIQNVTLSCTVWLHMDHIVNMNNKLLKEMNHMKISHLKSDILEYRKLLDINIYLHLKVSYRLENFYACLFFQVL